MEFNCRSCSSNSIAKVIDLGKQPWCNHFLKESELGSENTYPLELVFCKQCKLLQLNHTIPKEMMFSNHQYLSSMTMTLEDHFFNVAEENKTCFDLQENDLIIDIGGNDGFQLIQYRKLGLKNLVNVESATNIAKISRSNGINTINEYFNEESVSKCFEHGGAKLINASGVFFHLEELHSVIRAIRQVLAKDGVFVVQFMYAGAMLENYNFDTIYHEHLCYYTMRSLINLLSPYELEVFDAYYADIHSGSIIAKICHKNSKLDVKTDRFYETLENDEKYDFENIMMFAEKIKQYKHKFHDFLLDLKNQGKTIYAYGAPAKGNTLLNYCNITNSVIDKAVEINELKLGYYLPQSHIPVYKETKEDIPDYYLLLSHNFAEEIIRKNKDIMRKGTKFIIPFPKIKVIGIQDIE